MSRFSTWVALLGRAASALILALTVASCDSGAGPETDRAAPPESAPGETKAAEDGETLESGTDGDAGETAESDDTAPNDTVSDDTVSDDTASTGPASTDDANAEEPQPVEPPTFTVAARVVLPPGEIRRRHERAFYLLPRSAHPNPTVADVSNLPPLTAAPYEFEKCEPGEYWLASVRQIQSGRLSYPIHTSFRAMPVDVSDADAVVDVSVAPPDPANSIRVQVVDAGVPQLEVDVEHRWLTISLNEPTHLDVATLDNGTHVVIGAKPITDRQRERDGRRDAVLVTHPDGRKVLAVVDDQPQRSVTVDLAETGTVTAKVLGVPADWQGTLARLVYDETHLEYRVPIGADGQAVFGPAQVGPCHLEVLAKHYVNGQPTPTVARVAFDLARGLNELTITVPKLHTVEIETPNAKPGSLLYLLSTDSFLLTGRRFSANVRDGKAVFPLVPAGEYCVAGDRRAKPPQSMWVKIPADGAIQFASEPSNALLVHPSVTERVPTRAAGLKAGDLLLPADGEAFDSFRDAILRGSAQDRTVRLLRNGEIESYPIDVHWFQRLKVMKKVLRPISYRGAHGD